ncbi:hypothetical protein [Aeromicrobium sp. UC242_57]|uniref:hypothetical protein n=1 Tax=Aeromicrobium sp. UC242_57 TaxID=3374624 RepID=UPI0037B7EC36
MSSPGPQWSASGADEEDLGDEASDVVADQIVRTVSEGSTRYTMTWSLDVSDTALGPACDQVAAWLVRSSKVLPGDVDDESDPVPSSDDVVADCLRSVQAQPGEGVDQGFGSYPNTRKNGYQYGVYASGSSSDDRQRLTVGYTAMHVD